jgi:hypothetical protein
MNDDNFYSGTMRRCEALLSNRNKPDALTRRIGLTADEVYRLTRHMRRKPNELEWVAIKQGEEAAMSKRMRAIMDFCDQYVRTTRGREFVAADVYTAYLAEYPAGHEDRQLRHHTFGRALARMASGGAPLIVDNSGRTAVYRWRGGR